MAQATGMSQSAESRIWRAFGLKPQQTGAGQVGKQATELAERKLATRRVLGGRSMVNRVGVQVSGATTRRRATRRRDGHKHSLLRGGAMRLLLVAVGLFALLSGVFLEA